MINSVLNSALNSIWYFSQTPQTLTMKSALEGMLAGEGIYMKFNREFTRNEEIFDNAIDRATDVLRAQGGPTVSDALVDNVKVGIAISL